MSLHIYSTGTLIVIPSYLWYWNKWSCKLYLEGKVQQEHFFKKQAMQAYFLF
jgi:hypothetical protein